MNAKFEVYQENDGWHWRLLDAKGVVIAVGAEVFTNPNAATQTTLAVRRLSTDALVEVSFPRTAVPEGEVKKKLAKLRDVQRPKSGLTKPDQAADQAG